jgi:hypothetical protein
MSRKLSPRDAAMRGRIGGLTTSSRYDGAAITTPARAAFEQRWYADIPEDLPPAERERRARAARKAFYTKLARRSAQTRAQRAAARHP